VVHNIWASTHSRPLHGVGRDWQCCGRETQCGQQNEIKWDKDYSLQRRNTSAALRRVVAGRALGPTVWASACGDITVENNALGWPDCWFKETSKIMGKTDFTITLFLDFLVHSNKTYSDTYLLTESFSCDWAAGGRPLDGWQSYRQRGWAWLGSADDQCQSAVCASMQQMQSDWLKRSLLLGCSNDQRVLSALTTPPSPWSPKRGHFRSVPVPPCITRRSRHVIHYSTAALYIQSWTGSLRHCY